MTDPHEQIINGLNFLMLPVKGGTFRMGSKPDDEKAYSWEKPDHNVVVSDFYLGQYPVTQDLWLEIMGENPSFFPGERRPVETVSWDDAHIFVRKLNDLTQEKRPQGHTYRLPTEAEWEFAARGGVNSCGYEYACSNKLKEVGWFSDNSHGETKPVGMKAPNDLGLYDMSGNVSEWCEDDWHDSYDKAPKDGSAWIDSPERGSLRVDRGGAWSSTTWACRIADRRNWQPGHRGTYLGFRLALALQ